MEYVRRFISHMMNNQDKLALSGSIIGANVGVYLCSNPPNEFSLQTYIGGVMVGGVAGAAVGFMSPVIILGMILGAPGLLASKLHSFHKESQKKAETQVVLQDPLSQKKEGKHE